MAEQQIRLGKTDLIVNPIGLGANAVGGHNIYPDMLNDETGKEVVRTALKQGINFLDTAYIYGPKHSERLIGEVLKETGQRQNTIIATKAAHKFVDGKIVIDNSPAFLKTAVDEALKRLQTDYIDLFYIHFPDEHTPKDEAVDTLKQLKDAGKIRAIGVSNFSIDQLREANKDGHVDVLQSEYNLFKRDTEKELLPYTAEHNISLFLTSLWQRDCWAGNIIVIQPFRMDGQRTRCLQVKLSIENLDKVEQLRSIAQSKDVEVAHLVLAWYLTQPSIDALIPGAKRPEQVI